MVLGDIPLSHPLYETLKSSISVKVVTDVLLLTPRGKCFLSVSLTIKLHVGDTSQLITCRSITGLTTSSRWS